MKPHSLIQTSCLVILATAGVYSAVQLKNMGNARSGNGDSSSSSMHRAAILKTRGEARIAANDEALGLSYLSAALALNSADDKLRVRIATLRAKAVLKRPMMVDAQTAIGLQILFESVLDVSSPTSPQIEIALGKVLTVRGLQTEAIEMLDSAIKAHPTSAEALLFRADVSLQQQKWAEGLDRLNKASALDANNSLIQYGRGIALYAQEKFENALIAFTKAANVLSIGEVWLRVGNTAARLEKWEVAENAFIKAERLEQSITIKAPLYATTLAQRGKLEQAIQAANVRAQRTGDLRSYADLSNWYLELKKYASAIPILMELRKVQKKEPDFDCKLGYAWEKLEKSTKALKFFKQCEQKAEGVEVRKQVFEFAQNKVRALTTAAAPNGAIGNQTPAPKKP
jgi:tetratricopeptide (TPR) repeat protein